MIRLLSTADRWTTTTAPRRARLASADELVSPDRVREPHHAALSRTSLGHLRSTIVLTLTDSYSDDTVNCASVPGRLGVTLGEISIELI